MFLNKKGRFLGRRTFRRYAYTPCKSSTQHSILTS